jgi:trans-2,3-dihydro-3-hydroxyanthranilate isomerase
MSHRLSIVDVFAEQPYAGNQLAVVITDGALSEATMQAVAAEMNFSETTFVGAAPEPDGGYRVRIFTPAQEIEFAGHPILGTASVLRQQLGDGVTTLKLNLPVGQVPVRFEADADGKEIAWFEAPPVSLGPTCGHEEIAAALGLVAQDIDTRAPVQQCSAGTSAMLVPLRSLDALRRCRLDLEAYAEQQAAGFPPLVYLFTAQTHQRHNDLCARFFFEAHGLREDPASGNAAAFLGAYLLQHRFLFGSNLSLRIEQGYEMRRPSLVLLRARDEQGRREVAVGGAVVATVRGELL